ncbi:MAG: right-handed parallel beta-helix repeat-containing protein, partial [Flavobacteriales bacterium]
QNGNPTELPHHVIVRNCTIRDCGGGGIYTYSADHVSILNNTVLNCGWYAPYGNSGISNFQNWNSDGGTGVKMRIEGNICAGNFNYVPFIAVGQITDGNGIIIDDTRNSQNGSTLGVYTGGTYVANNVCFANGGRGIHAFFADHVTVVNNTTFHNCLSPAIDDGEYTAYFVDDMTFRNNIALPDAGIPPMDQFNATALTVDNNLWGANTGLADPFGTNTLVGDPQFVSPSEDPALADFQLASGSPAINVGADTDAPPTDILGNARPVGSVDLGAYEYQLSATVANVSAPVDWYVFQDKTSASVLVVLPEAVLPGAEVLVLDASGRMVARQRVGGPQLRLDASTWSAGVHVVELITSNGGRMARSFVW